MEIGRKTEMRDGVNHCRPDDMVYQEANVYGTMLRKSPIFEGDHGVRSAFFRMDRGCVLSNHEHTKWVQVAVLSGCIHVKQGQSSFSARPGEVYFLDPGHPHTETAVEDTLVLVTQGEDRPGW